MSREALRRSGCSETKLQRDVRPDTGYPAAKRFIGDFNTALSHQIIDISETECESAIEPHGVLDNRTRKVAMTV